MKSSATTNITKERRNSKLLLGIRVVNVASSMSMLTIIFCLAPLACALLASRLDEDGNSIFVIRVEQWSEIKTQPLALLKSGDLERKRI